MSDASNRGLLSTIHSDVEWVTEARIDLSERGAWNRRHATAVPIFIEKFHSCFKKDLARYKMIRWLQEHFDLIQRFFHLIKLIFLLLTAIYYNLLSVISTLYEKLLDFAIVEHLEWLIRRFSINSRRYLKWKKVELGAILKEPIIDI